METIAQAIAQAQHGNNETKSLQSISHTKSQAIEIQERYGNSVNFLKLFNPDMQTQYCKNIERCIVGQAPTLQSVSQAYGENITEVWLEAQLKNLSEFSGCKEKLTVNNIEEIARVIILTHPDLKVSELMLFFLWFKAGKYGKFYGAVDGLAITEALQDFRKERSKIRVDYYQRQQEQQHSQQQEENTIDGSEIISKLLTHFKK